MNCDRCGGEATGKKITSKKTGKEYFVFECQAGCKAGDYKYSFFPPREPQAKPRGEPVAMGQDTLLNSIAGQLVKISRELETCVKLLSKIAGTTSVTQSELEPDDKVPF